MPAVVLAVSLGLVGCTDQPEEANDNGPQPQPNQPGDVVQSPVGASPRPSELPADTEGGSPAPDAN